MGRPRTTTSFDSDTMLSTALLFTIATSVTALVVPARAPAPRMGLSVGDDFPKAALKNIGAAGKNSVVFFYGADSAPSCSKEIEAFDSSLSEFQSAGVTVVGVRNEKGATLEGKNVKLVIDEDDEIRKELGIKKDFGLLGGRETYVIDKSGKVVSVHNNQFDPKSHVTTSLAAVAELKKNSPPAFELPDIKTVAGVFGINLYGLK